MEPDGRTAVGTAVLLLTSPCFRKGAESRHHHGSSGAPSLPIWQSWPDGTPVLFSATQVGSGRVMMTLPVDVADLCPWSGDVEAPPKSRSSLSCMAEAEPELLGRARRRSFGRGQGGVRALGRAKRSSSSSGALA
jgi:hypothetical protein